MKQFMLGALVTAFLCSLGLNYVLLKGQHASEVLGYTAEQREMIDELVMENAK